MRVNHVGPASENSFSIGSCSWGLNSQVKSVALRDALLLYAPLVALLCLSGCTSERSDLSEPIALSPFASQGAPISTSNDVAIISEEIVCLSNSYEFRIHCVDRINGNATVIGGEGRGPGEFGAPPGIRRSRDGHVVAIDIREDRLTLFKPNGTLVSETRLPSGFSPTLLRGDRLFGFELVLDFENEFQPSYVPMEVDVSSGEVLWKRADLAEAVDRECFNPAVGASTPDGGLVLQVCEYELAFFSHKDAPTVTVVASPSYVEALPNERDLAAHIDDMSEIQSIFERSFTESQMDALVAEFLEKPKEWLFKPGTFDFDNQNHLWVATTRDRDAFSYFDIWTDTTYVGAVRVKDRLMGFDIFESTLVTLVERAPDKDGVAERAVDWYDLGEVDWSR